jgi:hypothetical protein
MARNDAEILKEAKKVQAEKIELQKKSIALTEKEQKQLESLISKQKELRKEISELRQEKLDALKGEESSIKSMGSMYGDLNDLQTEGLRLASENTKFKTDITSIDKEGLSTITKIQELNRSIAQLGSEDVEARAALTNEYNDQMGSLGTILHGNTKVIQSLKQQNSLAQNYADMSSEQKELIQSQHDLLEGVKKTIQGTLMTVKTLYGNITGAVGGLISGFGVVVGKIGEVNSELGTSMFQADGVGRSAGVLSLVFSDAATTAKDLSAALGDTNKATFELQASVGLMATNMGISGSEATKLVSSFSMLNGNSTDVALDMSKTSQEFAKQNGIIPAQLMGDLANSAEEFALFGKDGGENILRAAGYAAKLGTNMATLSGIAEGLLDFESSVTKELELGAMLGRNINLNKARELAYAGDIEGATRETLKELGGIDAFNKMDYYQKKQTADLLGVSVAELQKMNSKMENAGSLGSVISENFSVAGESINAGLNKYLGTGLKGLGGMVTAAGQMGTGFKALGMDMGGMVGSLKKGLKHLIMYPIYLAKAAAIKVGSMMGIGGGAAKGAKSVASKGASSVADKVKVPDTKGAKGGGAGKSLKSLAGGLKAMGNAKVLFGALNLIPTAIGFVAIIAGLPGMLGVSLLGAGAGAGLIALAPGLTAMASTFAGIGAVALTGLAFGILLAGIPAMMLLAIAGPLAAGGIAALVPALVALGGAMVSGVGALGLAALIAAGVGLGASLALIGAGAMMMGAGIMMAAAGFSLLLPALGTFMAGITLKQVVLVGLFAYSLLALGASLAILGVLGGMGVGVMMGLGIAIMMVGAGMSVLGSALGMITSAVVTMSESMGTFATGLSSVLEVVTLENVAKIAALAYSLGILGLASALALPSLLGLSGVMILLGVGLNLVGFGLQMIGGGMGSVMTTLTQLTPLLQGIMGTIAPIGLLSLAFMGLAASLMFLGAAGIFALPTLIGIAAASAGIALVAEIFGFGGGESSEAGAIEGGTLSEYETNMLNKMDQLIQATSSQRDIYLDRDKVTNVVMDRGERSAVNKFKLNRA